MKTLTRKQAREALEQVPMEQIFSGKAELTHKQREFCKLIALGETGSGAYRKAYKSKAKTTSVACEASKLKAKPNIQQTIDAFRLAQAAQEYQTPAQLRALVIHSLVKVLADDNAKDATKVAAAKVLGTVTEVAAFTERRETRIIKSSADAKAEVLARLREIMRDGAEDAKLVDADSLLSELQNNVNEDIVLSDTAAAESVGGEPMGGASAAAAAPGDPTPQNAVWSPTQTMHSNPHKQSASNLEGTPHSEVLELEAELSGKTPPSVNG